MTALDGVLHTTARIGGALGRAVRCNPACVLVLASAAGVALAGDRTATHIVAMKSTSYTPPLLMMRLGDVVVWRNEDPFPHTVTAAGTFDSKSIAAGASWTYKPGAAGEYAYICTFHPNMKGTLKVR
jgi:plastocyanin